MRVLFILLTGLPILLGALIYISCRDESFLVSLLLERALGTEVMIQFNHFICHQINLSDINVRSLPSALWVFSTALLSSRLNMKNKWCWLLIFISPLVYSLTLESLQYFHVTDGTYDFFDVLYSTGGWLLAACVAKIYGSFKGAINLHSGFVFICYASLILGNVC